MARVILAFGLVLVVGLALGFLLPASAPRGHSAHLITPGMSAQ
jgi:hypothetical protein